MKKTVQKLLSPLVIATLSIAGLVATFTFSPARADDNNDTNSAQVESAQNTNESSSQDEVSKEEKEANKVEEQESEEVEVHDSITQDQADLMKQEIPEIHVSDFHTYGDVIADLNSLKSALENIKTTAAAGVQADPTLSPAEKALFDLITVRHRADLVSFNARLDELLSLINDLTAILTPIADQSISNNLGIRSLIVQELKGLREQVEKARELADLNLEAVDTETQ